MRKLILMLLMSGQVCLGQLTSEIFQVKPSGNRSSVGNVRFFAKDNVHFIGIAPPDTLSASHIFRLPGSDPGGCINTDGAYNMSIGGCGGANSTVVSAAKPMQVYCHFTDADKSHIRFDFSRDYLNLTSVRPGGWGPYEENRDTSCYDDGTTIYIVASPTPTHSALAQYWTTTDLKTISGPTTIDMTTVRPGTNADYAPEFVPNAATGVIGTDNALSTDGGASFTPYFVQLNLAALATCTTSGTADCTSAAVVSSSSFSITGSSQNHIFDLQRFYDPGSSKWYAFYVDEYVRPSDQYYFQNVAYAVSSTFAGPYAQVSAPTSDTSSGTFAFSGTSEAPSVLPLADSVARYGVSGCMRVYADTWLFLYNASGLIPRNYTVQYVDTCPATVGGNPFAVIKNTPIPINISTAEHGTFMQFTDQNRANLVYQARDYFLNGAITEDKQRFGVNFSVYSGLTVVKDPANYFLGNNTPVSIAVGGNDPGAFAGPRSFFVLSWCGIDPGSCFPTIGGEARMTDLNQSSGGGGMIQLGNNHSDTGEVSIAYLDSPFVWGGVPLSGSAFGKNGYWGSGINNQYLGPIGSGGNRGNNAFFWYNGGLGPHGGTNPTVGNPGFEVGMTGAWTGYGSATTSRSTDVANTGTYSFKVVGAGGGYQLITGLIPNKGYVARVATWAPAGNASAVYIKVDNNTGGDVAQSANLVPTNVWYEIATLFTADSSGNGKIYLNSDGASTGQPVYFDDVQFYLYDSPSGAFPAYISSFNGAFHANYAVTLGNKDTTALSGIPYANFDTYGGGLINVGSGKIGSHDAFLRTGSVEVGGTAGDAYFFGPTGSEHASLASTNPNIIDCGDGTAGHNNCIFKVGILEAATSAHFFSAGTIGGNLAVTGTGLFVLGNGSSDTDNHANLNLGSLTVGTVAGDSVAFGSNANISSAGAGLLQVNTGTSTDSAGIFGAGYINAGTLFSQGGSHNGLTGSIGCHLTTISVRNAAGTGTQSLTYCDALTNNTVWGGIVAP